MDIDFVEEFYGALCRAMDSVVVQSPNVSAELLKRAARDTLHTMSHTFHHRSQSYGLLVRLSDNRVLATTCDFELLLATDDAFDNAAARSCVVCNLTGENMNARARTTLFDTMAQHSSVSQCVWLADVTFALEGGWVKPLEFSGFARRLVINALNDVSPFCLLVLAKRKSGTSMSVTSSATASRASFQDDVHSVLTATSVAVSATKSSSPEAASIKATLDSVASIDDEIVLVCNQLGTIMSQSAPATTLLGDFAKNVAESLRDGAEAWKSLIRADQSSRLSHELVDGTACRFRVSPVHSALYVVVIEMPTACDRDSLQAKQQHHQHQHQREQQRRDSADARSGDARRDSFRSVDSTPVSTIGSSSLRTRSSDSDADDADLVVDEFRQLSVSGGCGATSAYLRNRFGATPNELATVSNRRRSEVDDTAGTSGGRRRSLASEQQRRALKGFATTFDQSSSRRRDNVSPAAAVKPITPLNVPLTTASLSTSGVTLRGAQSGRALLRNSTESNNGATTTTLPRSNSASSLRSTAAATTSGVGRPTVAAAQSYAIAGFSSGETTRALAHSGGVKNAGYSHRRNALKTMSGGGGGDNKGSDEQYAARTSPPTTPRAGATASAAAAASAATSTGERIVGSYVLSTELARGASGVIYVGYHGRSHELVAIKKRRCHDAGELNEALQEAMTLARVNSTCVIRFHNAFFEEVMHEGKRIFELFVVTDYCAGGDLFTTLMQCSRDSETHEHTRSSAARHARLPLQQWALEICVAVNALHELGIAHRDIKLENFVLREDGSLCLIDFGVSVVYGKGDTMIGGAAADIDGVDAAYDACSPFYAPPEAFVAPSVTRSTSTTTTMMTALGDDDGDGGNGDGGNGDGSDNAVDVAKFGGDLWALGIVLLELTSCHIFQNRKDRLILGKLACQCSDDEERWRQILGRFLNDIVDSMAHCAKPIAHLLSVDRSLRVKLPFLTEN